MRTEMMKTMRKRIFALVLCAALLMTLGAGSLARAEEDADTGLPQIRIYIDPEEFRQVVESPGHAYRAETGAIRIDVPDGFATMSGAKPLSTEQLRLEYIRGRGNSTWLNSKKPFRFKLEKGEDLLGMGSNKHWVLLANACDGTLMRNSLMSYMGEAAGLEFTPEMVPADLYVNDEYMGSYVLGEQIRIGKNRVNIGDEGVLLSMDPDVENPEENIFSTKLGLYFLAEDPDFTEIDDEELRASAGKLLQQVEDAVYGSGTPVGEVMDLRSAAKFWWIQEAALNFDSAYTGSTYLYLDGGELYWGPLWDFDLGMYVAEDVSGFNVIHMPWIDYLRAYDPAFRQILREEWAQLAPALEEIARDGGVIDRYAEMIRKSWEKNEAAGFSAEAVQRGTLDELTAGLKDWYRRRTAWINEHIETGLEQVDVHLYFYSADGEYLDTAEFPLDPGCAREEDFPQVTAPEGYTFAGWADENGRMIGPGDRVLDNTSVRAVFTPAEP